MARKFSSSQLRSQVRQVENKFNRDVNLKINRLNREVQKTLNSYNADIKQQKSNISRNSLRIQKELERLIANNGNKASSSYKASVEVLHSSYKSVLIKFDMKDSISPVQEFIYDRMENENANSLETANVVLNDYKSDITEYSLQDTIIINQLSSISKDLDERWKGALFSLNPINPDATRHFCTSAREIFTEIFDMKAKDIEVFKIYPNCAKTERGNATRRFKIKYFLYNKGFQDDSTEEFIENDIENILNLFHELSSGTHGKTGKYTITQLNSIKKRVEDGILFLCSIAT